jgi:L-asparaginase II
VEPFVVEVRRGDVVESRHRVHAAVVRDGAVVLAVGDVERVAFLRSAAKPIQALPVVRAVPWLDDEQVALLCASHLGRPEQLAIVERTLAGAGVTADDLECGPEPTPLGHNCSGKHAGFLALCRARGWDLAGYRLAGHPCQQAMLEEVASATGLEPGSLPTAVDGCGVVTFAVPLRVGAAAFARLPELAGAARVVTAMRTHPELLRGPVAADAVLIRALPGWIAKGGAEGLFCAGSPDGLGIALKVEDGAFRAVVPAMRHVLALVGLGAEGLDDSALRNSRGEQVGTVDVAC